MPRRSLALHSSGSVGEGLTGPPSIMRHVLYPCFDETTSALASQKHGYVKLVGNGRARAVIVASQRIDRPDVRMLGVYWTDLRGMCWLVRF
jgi:hypothetical protein